MVDFRSLEGTGDFYFIRHGESEANLEGVIQGRTHSRLTDKGRAQAREAGLWFKSRPLELIISSPLERAAETARLIAEALGIKEITYTEELTEIDTGLFTSMSFVKAREGYPLVWKAFQHASWEAVPDAERVGDLLKRAERTWGRLLELHAQGRRGILSVTHSGFLQWILKYTLGGTSWMPLLSASDNCCISHLRVVNGAKEVGDGGDAMRAHLATWMMVNAPVNSRSQAASGKSRKPTAGAGGGVVPDP
jgi:broad specificity phosphatase PhoE